MMLAHPEEVRAVAWVLQRAWLCVSGDITFVSASEFVSRRPVCMSERVRVFEWQEPL